MKKPRALALALTLSLLAVDGLSLAKAEDKPEEQRAGKSLGGMNGMMIGAIGGPIGMLVGAGVGALFGNGAEQAADKALSPDGEAGSDKTSASATSGKTVTR